MQSSYQSPKTVRIGGQPAHWSTRLSCCSYFPGSRPKTQKPYAEEFVTMKISNLKRGASSFSSSSFSYRMQKLPLKGNRNTTNGHLLQMFELLHRRFVKTSPRLVAFLRKRWQVNRFESSPSAKLNRAPPKLIPNLPILQTQKYQKHMSFHFAYLSTY